MGKRNQTEIAWHPDFRQESLLPDIKPVRSIFFINFVAFTLTAILFIFWICLEWQVGSLNYFIGMDEKKLAAGKKENEELLRQSGEFERWAKLIKEIQGFVGVPFKPSSFLTAMGEIRPAHMTLSQIAYSIETRQDAPVYVIVISGSVTGASTQATHSVEAFRDKLETLPLFNGLKFNVKPILKTFERNRGLDLYSFTINLEVKL